MSGSADNPLTVDYLGLAQLASSLRLIGSDIMTGDTTMGTVLDAVTFGAGDFGPVVDHGATAFALAWREITKICGESLAVICNNMGNYTMDLQATDLNNSPY